MVLTTSCLNDMSNEEVLYLIHHTHSSDAKMVKTLQDYLIKRNKKLVLKIAHKYNFNKMELDDRVQEGTLGLYKAIQTFDCSMKLKFSTHAHHWIAGYIRNNSSKQNFTMRLPNNVVDTRNRIYEYRDMCAKDWGYNPTDAEVSKELGIPLSIIKAVQNSEGGINPTSIDQPILANASGEELQVHEVVGGAFLEDCMDRSEKLISLEGFILELDDVDQLIVNRVLGLDGYSTKSLKELDRLISDESGCPMSSSVIRTRWDASTYYLRSRFKGRKCRTKINSYPAKTSVDSRDIVIVLNDSLKQAYITGDLFYSQLPENQILGFFLNNKETHELVLHECTQSIVYVSDVHRKDVDPQIDAAISELRSLGFTIINITDFYPEYLNCENNQSPNCGLAA